MTRDGRFKLYPICIPLSKLWPIIPSCMHECSLSKFCELFGIHVTLQTPLPMEFSRQEYWSELPFPTAGYLPDPGIEPTSPVSLALAGRFFITVPPEKLLFPPASDFSSDLI